MTKDTNEINNIINEEERNSKLDALRSILCKVQNKQIQVNSLMIFQWIFSLRIWIMKPDALIINIAIANPIKNYLAAWLAAL
jgi:hypothetical protein